MDKSTCCNAIRKFDAIQSGQNLVVAFTTAFANAVATNGNPQQRSILVQELINIFFTCKFELVVFDRAIRIAATDYTTLYDLITRVATDTAYGLVGSLATVCYKDGKHSDDRDSCCHKGRSFTMIGSEHLLTTIVADTEDITGLIVLENRYNVKEVRKDVFKFPYVELRAVARGDFVPGPVIASQTSNGKFIVR